MIIFLFIVAIVSFFTIMPYEFIKYKVIRFKRIPEIHEKPTLIKTNQYNLILEYIEQSNDEHKIANDFLYKIVDYGDETAIFKVKNEGMKTELDGIYLTPFKYKINEFLYLQKVRSDKSGEPTSDLIKFNTISGKIESNSEIGPFELDNYDEKESKIFGYNLTKNITIEFKKASA